MIKNSDMVEYLRETFGNNWRVDGAVSFYAATDKSRLMLPCFYVNISPTVVTSQSELAVLQTFDTTIEIRLVCLSTQDRTGKYAQDLTYYARRALLAALLNKRFVQRYDPIEYVRDYFEALDEARYMHVFMFRITGTLDFTDGVQFDYDEFNSIHIDYNITESDPLDLPNAQDVINTLQD